MFNCDCFQRSASGSIFWGEVPCSFRAARRKELQQKGAPIVQRSQESAFTSVWPSASRWFGQLQQRTIPPRSRVPSFPFRAPFLVFEGHPDGASGRSVFSAAPEMDDLPITPRDQRGCVIAFSHLQRHDHPLRWVRAFLGKRTAASPSRSRASGRLRSKLGFQWQNKKLLGALRASLLGTRASLLVARYITLVTMRRKMVAQHAWPGFHSPPLIENDHLQI